MFIPFSKPLIDDDVISEMNDTLINTKWLTSGPKVLALEQEFKQLVGLDNVVCVNSWVSGAMLVLRWLGVGNGDEVIIPSYTYAGTALACLNIGAKPIFVDVLDDFTIDYSQIKSLINTRTKVIIPVDIAGLPCNYEKIYEIVSNKNIIDVYSAKNEIQHKLGRILVLADAAHSIGAKYKGVQVGKIADISIFSLHSVKNITTGEGGAICLNLPAQFSNNDVYRYLKILSLNGQTKSAFDKNLNGTWKYDIIYQGFKANMTDICASVGLAQIKKYTNSLLPERKSIIEYYNNYFKKFEWANIPTCDSDDRISSGHLYLLRINSINEIQRDMMINTISEQGVGVNVHYIPLPMFTLFKKMGYDISEYPNSYNLYKNEITLPVYNGLTSDQLEYICNSVYNSYCKLFNNI